MRTFEIVLEGERGVTLTMCPNLESPEFYFSRRPLAVVLPGGTALRCAVDQRGGR